MAQLAGTAAHDFKNLLAVILGNVELLEEDLAHDEALLAMVRLIRDAGLRGQDLAEQLLLAARAERDRQ
jgi:signal transduction histidine kinase